METIIYSRSAQADATLAGDRAAIFHRGSGSAITLNPTGTVLWEAMVEPRSATDLAAEVRRKWPEVDEATARRDVEAFLGELMGHGLIVASGE